MQSFCCPFWTAQICCPFWTTRPSLSRPLNSYGPSRETRAVVPWAGHHPPHDHFNSDTSPSASTFLSSILDSSQRVCRFKYQFDSAVQRWSCRAKHSIADDVRAAVLRDITVLQHVLQLAQHGRARHPDCVCDLLSCQSLTTQRPRPQSPRYVREFSKRGYVVRGEDAGNQQALELLCGISQDQPFLPAWDVFRSHRLGEPPLSQLRHLTSRPRARACCRASSAGRPGARGSLAWSKSATATSSRLSAVLSNWLRIREIAPRAAHTQCHVSFFFKKRTAVPYPWLFKTSSVVWSTSSYEPILLVQHPLGSSLADALHFTGCWIARTVESNFLVSIFM